MEQSALRIRGKELPIVLLHDQPEGHNKMQDKHKDQEFSMTKKL